MLIIVFSRTVINFLISFLSFFKSIIPCGIKDKGVTNLNEIKNQNYKELGNKLIENLILNLENQVF